MHISLIPAKSLATETPNHLTVKSIKYSCTTYKKTDVEKIASRSDSWISRNRPEKSLKLVLYKEKKIQFLKKKKFTLINNAVASIYPRTPFEVA